MLVILSRSKLPQKNMILFPFKHDCLYWEISNIILVKLEKALILLTLKLEDSSNIASELTSIKGVLDASIIYGPWDAYAIIETESKEELRNIVIQIRQLDGVSNTITCNVIP
jgi:DNA-binding Lrp family transcriptional regulator